jgi:hypothetical protein
VGSFWDFELWDSHYLLEPVRQSLFVLVYLITILLISASKVVRIIGVSHHCPAVQLFLALFSARFLWAEKVTRR